MQRLLKENFLSEKDLYAELPELLSDKKSSRESDKERIFIRAIGLVNQDIAMANAIYQSTPKKGIGTRSVMIHGLIDLNRAPFILPENISKPSHLTNNRY